MPTGPAARLGDPVSHPLPPVLTGGQGSPTVLIGMRPAWRGLPAAAVAGLQSAKTAADNAIQTAEAATQAATGSPGQAQAYENEQNVKTQAFASMAASIATAAAGGSDVHQCATPSPLPPHGPGVVIDGSATVLINNLPACRMGDTLLEAIGPPNKIAMGAPTVIIGG
jgi:uncharacterized Zn-binding protein involved in type VI secretion